jgi:prepilin-type N-terminal cleavage/methylation domain-containing protein
MTRRVRARGLALLEVLVALVLLSLLVVGYLRLFQGGHHLFARSQEWSDAIGYATDAMERAKTAPVEPGADHLEELPAGWGREIATSEWQPGVTLVTVTVTMPDGGQVALHRLRAETRQ